ncbi:hypothetical protein [Marininema halotolerans]|uniref:Barstar (Barnase inhibitor) n=1 Tax=Marininema halotolerans TaxID=1155944 RepID=A0A1I6PZP0_9BACL|nr:hypothetical protein [Marininema halotolerans]SFS45709.1 hypothetical protein SAMN05444972_102245 [Marininema halotolerans]
MKLNLNGLGYKIFEINGNNIVDSKSFFEHGIVNLPQDPVLSKEVNHDALLDSLFGGLDEGEYNKVAIFWNDANNMLEHGLEGLLRIITVFQVLKDQIMDPRTGFFSKETDLLIFLFGSGKNFD